MFAVYGLATLCESGKAPICLAAEQRRGMPIRPAFKRLAAEQRRGMIC